MKDWYLFRFMPFLRRLNNFFKVEFRKPKLKNRAERRRYWRKGWYYYTAKYNQFQKN